MDSTPTVSRLLSGFIHATSFSDLPAAIVDQAKSRVLDCLATAIASRALPVPGVVLKFVGANRGEATVFGHSLRVPAIDAAFVNATLVNGTTHDDFLYKSHPGAVVIPAGIAVAEEEHSSGREFLTSVVLGYELVARAYLGAPAMLPRFRASGVAGAIGAAATAGKLLKLPVPELMSALGCSAMFASGFGEGFRAGTMDVKLNVGWACRSGVSAAALARLGATSAPSVFEGKSGFFNAFAGTSQHAGDATQNLGHPYLIEDTTYKERPVCIFVQTPVHLAYAFQQRMDIDPSTIRRVTIQAPEATYTNPGFQNTAPYSDPLQARISARFCTAAALLGKPVGEYAFYRSTSDPEVLALAERIDLLEPTHDTSRVYLEVTYDGGVERMEGVEMETLRPATEKVIAKFRRLTSGFLGSRTDRVMDTILNLDQVDNIHDLTDQLQVSQS